jgi:CRP-like cAMP-binding protein
VDSTVLLRRLEAIAEATAKERSVLISLPGTVREYRPHVGIVRVGVRPSVVCLMLDGMTSRYKVSADGKRQIMSFHIQGDIPDVQSLFIDVMDHSLCALVKSTVLAIPHDKMCNIVDWHPRIAHLVWRTH